MKNPATLPGRILWNAFFWTYERATWQYDVMVIAILIYSVVPRPSIWFVIASRIVLIPVIAGVSYEVIRLAARNIQRRWVRVVMKPGLLLQKLTTREPDLEHIRLRAPARGRTGEVRFVFHSYLHARHPSRRPLAGLVPTQGERSRTP